MQLPAAVPSAAAAPGRERLSTTAGYYMAFVSLGFFAASLGPTLPGLAANTRSVLSQISYLFTARALGYLIGSYIGGRLYDRLPGHKVMALGLGAMALVLFVMPLIPLLWLLVGIVLAGGIAEGALDVGGNTLLVWVHRDKVGPFMNVLHFFFGLGAFISPIVIAQLVLWSGTAGCRMGHRDRPASGAGGVDGAHAAVVRVRAGLARSGSVGDRPQQRSSKGHSKRIRG